MFKNSINLAFEKLTSQLVEPQWLQAKRQQALENFQLLGLPTKKSELWKYIDVKRLENLKQVTDIAGSGSAIFLNKDLSGEEISQNKKGIDLAGSGSVLFLNKDTSGEETSQTKKGTDRIKKEKKEEMFIFTINSDLPKDTSMLNITEVDEENWQDLKTDKERVFIELNMAMLNSGFELSIPENSQLKLHIQYQQVSEDWENIRTVINVGENAQLDLTESYDYDCRINHVAVINAEKNATLKLQSQKLLAKTAALIHYSNINCAENVTVEKCTTNNNAYLSHSIEDVNFNAENSYYKATSINVSHNNCHIADNIQINHWLGNCKSEVIKRDLATDKASIAVNAKAVVSVGADGSDVAQSIKNILLSEDARIYSRPELEINTDDVVAAHGSTTGALDDTALTYLRSRGIPKEQAHMMLIESFLQEANIFKDDKFLDLIEL